MVSEGAQAADRRRGARAAPSPSCCRPSAPIRASRWSRRPIRAPRRGRASRRTFRRRPTTRSKALCADPAVEIVYVATPHQHHARTRDPRGAARQARAGRKADGAHARRMRRDDRRRRGARCASHRRPQPFVRRADPAHARADRRAAHFGAVRMINALNYTDFLYRPRRPEELDTAQGGGAMFNQAAHQVDIVRLLGGGEVQSVRAATGAWDAGAPDRRRLFGAAHLRRRRVRVAHLWGLWALRFRRILGLDRRDGAGEEAVCRARRSVSPTPRTRPRSRARATMAARTISRPPRRTSRISISARSS